MSYRTWSATRWTTYLRRIQTPFATICARLGYRPPHRIHYIDTTADDRLRNCLHQRCDLVTGLVLFAERLGWIGPDSSLCVVGNGPTAVIATSLALARRIPVVHLQVEGVREMEPFAETERWVSADFYDTVLEPGGAAWRWQPPEALRPQLQYDRRLHQIMGLYSYHETLSSDLARNWLEIYYAILSRADTARERKWVPREVLAELKFNGIHTLSDLSESARAHDGSPLRGVGLILHTRFSAGEPLTHPQEGPAAFTSFPYWPKRCPEPWREDRAPLMACGGGDGALQDFLRACWGWDRPSHSVDRYYRVFGHGAEISALHERAKRARDKGDFPEAARLMVEAITETARVDELRKSGLPLAWHAELHDIALALERAAAAQAEAFGRLEDERLDQMRKPGSNEEELRREMRTRKTAVADQVHQFVQEGVKRAMQVLPAPVRLPARRVYLRTKREELGPCYAHNHFFALLTIEWLRRHAGYEPRIISEKDLALTWDVPAAEAADAEACAQHAAQGKLSIEGVSEPLGHLLLRFGPRRTPMF